MYYKLILLFVFFGILILFSSFRRDRKKKIVFFGDSITQQGIEPKGYITLIRNMLQKQDINNYELTGAGIGGNKVYDLYLRIEPDVINKSPEIVVIFIGVNDVWHKSTHGTGTDPDKFEKFYRAIIFKLQSAHAKVILCTPAVIGEKKNNANRQDDDLNNYAAIIRSIGNDLQLPVCDIRELFQNYIQENNINDADNSILTTDGVHLNDLGNRLIAEALLEKIEALK
jgi:lysophospholipase L1-like esterase